MANCTDLQRYKALEALRLLNELAQELGRTYLGDSARYAAQYVERFEYTETPTSQDD